MADKLEREGAERDSWDGAEGGREVRARERWIPEGARLAEKPTRRIYDISWDSILYWCDFWHLDTTLAVRWPAQLLMVSKLLIMSSCREEAGFQLMVYFIS